jgi:hypothetical protein
MLKKARSNADHLCFGEILTPAAQDRPLKSENQRTRYGQNAREHESDAQHFPEIHTDATFRQIRHNFTRRLVLRSTPRSPWTMTSLQVNAVTDNSLPPKEMRTMTAFQPGSR